MWPRTRTPSPVRRAPEAEPAQEAGFTLLEVMIAVAVIAIALVTLIGSQSQSVSLITGARFETMASLLAQWKMTDLMQRDPEQLALDSGNFGDDYPHFSWRVEVSELSENETGLPAVAGVLKRLDLTVANEQDSRLTYTLRTLVYKRPPPEKKAAETDDQDAGPRTTTPGATGGQR